MIMDVKGWLLERVRGGDGRIRESGVPYVVRTITSPLPAVGGTARSHCPLYLQFLLIYYYVFNVLFFLTIAVCSWASISMAYFYCLICFQMVMVSVLYVFCCHVMTPFNCCFIVIMGSFALVKVSNEVMEYFGQVLNALCVFVDRINFSFSWALCSYRLAFADPMKCHLAKWGSQKLIAIYRDPIPVEDRQVWIPMHLQDPS